MRYYWLHKSPQRVTTYPLRKGRDLVNLINITEAAERLGRGPWEVVRLIDAGVLPHVVLVDADSLDDFEESQ